MYKREQGAKAQLGAMGMHATVTASQMTAAQAIGSVTESMQAVNKHMDMKKMIKTMVDVQRENEREQGKDCLLYTTDSNHEEVTA